MLDHAAEYLGTTAEHADNCSSRMHTAAECSCGLADARAEVDDAAELLKDTTAAVRELVGAWSEGDIAGPVNTLRELLLG